MSRRRWDAEADLVVVGSGGAGLTGAVVAAAGGARVLVLEKTALLGGTTSMSGGGVWVAAHDRMGDVGVEDSPEEALSYLRAVVGEAGDADVLESLVENGPAMLRFLEEHAGLFLRPYPPVGASFDYRSQLPGAKHGGRSMAAPRVETEQLGAWTQKLRIGPQSRAAVDKIDHRVHSLHAQPPGAAARHLHRRPDEAPADFLANGTALVAQLLKGCLDHGVGIELETSASELVLESGRVVGVIAAGPSGPVSVRATQGVLIATGGFSHNAELRRLWLDRPLLGSCEIEENQGDGHLLGVAAGAQLAGVADAAWFPQGEGEGLRQLPHTLIVNGRGQRFVDEALPYSDVCEGFGTRTGQGGAKNIPAWVIFDGQACAKYQTAAAVAAGEWRGGPIQSLPIPGDDAVDRIRRENRGLQVAQTLAELAAEIEVDPAALEATVARFNDHARRGCDPDFGRGGTAYERAWGDPDHGPNPSLGTVAEPPFHAAAIYPGSLATKGGLRVNGRAEVLAAATGLPIPGLYAAGNCSSSVYPGGYPGAGGTIGPGMTFGYVAARCVLADRAAAAAAAVPV